MFKHFPLRTIATASSSNFLMLTLKLASCSVMGREVTGIHVVDKRPNCTTVASNGGSNDKVHVSPRIAAVNGEAKDHEVMECTEINAFVEESQEKKDVLSAKSTNHFAHLPEEKNEKPEAQEMGDNIKLSLPDTISSAAKIEHTIHSVSQPSIPAAGKNGTYTQTVGTEAVANGVNLSPNANNMYSPSSAKYSQVTEMFNELS